MKITSKIIHSILTIFISFVIVLLPLNLGKEIMWVNYTDCNDLTAIGEVISYTWLTVLYGFVSLGVFNFLKRYTDYK